MMSSKRNVLAAAALASASALAGYGVRFSISANEASAASAPASPQGASLIQPLPAPGAANPAAPAGADPTNAYVTLAERVMPAVVNISATTRPRPRAQNNFRTPEDFFEEFFGGSPRFRAPRAAPPRSGSLGTGFVIDEKGIVLTNDHVVGDADDIRIKFTESADEKALEGKVIGRDSELDVALIQIKTDRKLTALPLGDSDRLKVGEYVAAVGNPFGQGHSLTHGIISAKGRTNPMSSLSTWIQTDTPINPGNSGGPLLNLRGEVIGINNAIDARAQGIGFAIPINLVKDVLPQLQTKGKIARGYLGVMVGELTPDLAKQMGVKGDVEAPLVSQVEPGGPAYRAGVRPYDLILEFNGKPIKSARELTSQVVLVPEGKKVPLKVMRDDRTLELTVRVGKRPGRHEAGLQGEEDDTG
jgi:serine protease Do